MPDDMRGWPVNIALQQSLIQIPQMYAEPSRFGKVVAIGDGRMQDGSQHEFEVAVGDLVLCTRYPQSGSTVKYAGKDLFIMSEREILAKVGV
jgi:co-chaperonin GroES (HSP10)